MKGQLLCGLKQMEIDGACLKHSQQCWPEAGLWPGACPYKPVPPVLQVYGSVEDPIKKKKPTIK